MALYIVATPIGNNKDITTRALETLEKVDLVLCEDTRHSGQLLHNLGLKKPLLAFHEHNEVEKIPYVIKLLSEGQEIALISDAGTPLISDPGFKLVRQARNENLPVFTIPGPSAAIAAMSISGLPTDKFFFVGYLPKTSGKKQDLLQNLKTVKETLNTSLIFYESPHRIHKTLIELVKYFPDSQVSLQRELTKLHEEVLTDSIENVLKKIEKRALKGEITLVLN